MTKYLFIMSKKTKLKCVGVIVLAFIGSLLASTWPVRLGQLYTDISNGTISSISQGVIAVIVFGVIYLSAECITIVRRVMLDCIIATHESETRDFSIEKLLKMPVSYYSGCLSSEKTAQLNQGVAGFSQLIKIMCNDVFATVLTAMCTLAQVFLNAPRVMVGIMFSYLMLSVVISAFQIQSQNGIRENIVRQKNFLDGLIGQAITNLELIRGMNAEEFERNRLQPDILNISWTEKKHHRYMGTFDCFKQFCKISFQVILLVTSIRLISSGKMSAGSVITVCLLFQQLVKPIDEVYRFMDETASSVIKAKILLEVSASSSDEIFDIQSTEKTINNNDIRIENVVVTNPEKERPIAWYDNIVIPCDRKVALQGGNGCGKTSLIRSLNRYYPHIQGRITMFGKEQETYSQRELADVLFYTPQSSFFIVGTVRENLLYGIERPVSDEELVSALRSVFLTGYDHKYTVIQRDPMKALSSMINEKADELSGGMKQRLSLARAFLRRPKVFVFDEITANLDEIVTNDVLTNIEEYARKVNAGIIYISHDQKVVDRCDKVILLKNKLQKNTEDKEVA
ncbi:ABC transporter ATP-binding protein [Lachnospiraceae bacterium]|nr:ABC transporter ATP-binding protein [uncultured Schaedlerella sp.]NBI56879.1 ABC transporter ATP-binding protein [Lachnospiraceae bacterium]